ncbi:MAG: methionyl-tRNA formyltransferase [Akkermansia sp.]
MRIVLMATGDIAIPSFHALEQSGELVALFTQPDRPVGRHMTLTPPRIKTLALEAGIPVCQPERMRDAAAIDEMRAFKPDIIVVMAYGQILTQELIDVASIACINAHASLLPRHRGASCIQAAIEAGDDETGVSIMHVVKKLDAGDVICQAIIPLDGTETAESLHDDLAELTPSSLMDAIEMLGDGMDMRLVQDESLMTYAPKLLRHHGEINWQRPAHHVARKIRAYHSWPGTYTTYPSPKDGSEQTLKIFPPIDLLSKYPTPKNAFPGEVLEANTDGMIVACGGPKGGAIRVITLQPAGARKMNAESFFAGRKIKVGTVLGVHTEPED